MTTFDSQVVLGERYRDGVSGFEGVATGCQFYLHGCERVTLEQWDANNAELKELTFDAPRLVHIESLRRAPPGPHRVAAPGGDSENRRLQADTAETRRAVSGWVCGG